MMNKDIEILIARIKAAAKKATPGQWFVDGVKIDDGTGGDIAVAMFRTPKSVNPEQFDRKANATYIAQVNPENVMALITALESGSTVPKGWKQVPTRATASMANVKLPEATAWRLESGMFGGVTVTTSKNVARHWENDNQIVTPLCAISDVIAAIQVAGDTVNQEDDTDE